MIKYLQGLKKRKGFTLIELIIVIAIIAVLTAIILPSLLSNKGEITAANTYAENFYSVAQMLFTKYMKFESHLSTGMKNEAGTVNDTLKFTDSDPRVIAYNDKLLGNYPVGDVIYIEMFVDNGIQYIHAKKTLTELIQDVRGSTGLTAFEQQFMSDINAYSSDFGDGVYYALIHKTLVSTKYTDPSGLEQTLKRGYNVKVHSTYFTKERFNMVISNPTNYRDANLMFIDANILPNKEIMGVFSDMKSTQPGSDGYYIGTGGTYFMNVDDTLSALLPTTP